VPPADAPPARHDFQPLPPQGDTEDRAETVGEEWLVPHLFRFGASSLLNDVLLQRQKMTTGHYSGPDYVTID